MSRPIHKIAHIGRVEVHFLEEPGKHIQVISIEDGKHFTSVYPFEVVLDALDVTWETLISKAPRVSFYDDCDDPNYKEDQE